MIQHFKKEIRFLFVGGSSTLIDFIIYMVLSTKINISISKLVSMTIASIYSFFINKNWTFSNKEQISLLLVTKYIIGQLLNISINTSINTLVYNLCNYKIIAFICATIIAMIFNYLFQNYIVFKGGKEK